MNLSFLPLVNACLNALATVLLIVGLLLIKQRRWQAHRNVMLTATGVSVLFLALYLLHKWWRYTTTGVTNTPFWGTGVAKELYLTMLISHLILAMTVPVFAIRLIMLGLRRADASHRRLAKFAYPIWLYVSITGVIIYIVLYPMNPNH